MKKKLINIVEIKLIPIFESKDYSTAPRYLARAEDGRIFERKIGDKDLSYDWIEISVQEPYCPKK